MLSMGLDLLQQASGPPPAKRGPSCSEANPDGLAHGKEAQDREEYEHFQRTGKRRALLIGINYHGMKGELHGCINDVINLNEMLTNVYGFQDDEIRIMTDDTDCIPSKDNIIAGIEWLVRGAESGDSLWFSYSGHGGQQPDPEGLEEDGMNETLIPIDYGSSGMIPDNELAQRLLGELPDGVRMTVVIDACHSGSGLDLAFSWTDDGWVEAVNPEFVQADCIMISGCQDEQTSADARFGGQAAGALTTALLRVTQENPDLTYSELLPSLHNFMKENNFTQRPVMSSSQAFQFGRNFNLREIMYNKNPELGRVFRQKFESKPDPQIQQFMEGLNIDYGDIAALGKAVLPLFADFFK